MSSAVEYATTKRSAMEKFLHTAELLEKVVLHLSPIEIIATRRVSRAFRDTYDGSSKLQQCVYPPAEPEERWTYQNIPVNSRSYTYHRDQTLNSESIQRVRGLVLNPILFTSTRIAKYRERKVGPFAAGACVLDLNNVTSESSCVNMALTQPPHQDFTIRAYPLPSSADGRTHDWRHPRVHRTRLQHPP